MDGGDQKAMVQIAPKTICLYGHWIDGEKLLELRDGIVFLDGIRVFPPVREVGPIPSTVSTNSPLGQLVQRWRARERALRAAGASKESVVAEGKAFFESADVVETIEIDADATCTIYGKNNEGYLAQLWSTDFSPLSVEFHNSAGRGGRIYRRLLNYIQGGGGVIILSQAEKWFPKTVVESAEFRDAVDAIAAATGPIEDGNWDRSFPILWFEAEAIRNPLPDDIIRRK